MGFWSGVWSLFHRVGHYVVHTRGREEERERERGERTRGCGQLLYLIEHVKCYDWVTCHATADQ